MNNEISQYFYYLTIPGNESFLKQEIEMFRPEFRFSYSKKGFCTFKNIGDPISSKRLVQEQLIYALCVGENIKKIKYENIELEYLELKKCHQVKFNFYQLEILEVKEDWPINQVDNPLNLDYEIDFIRTGINEVFIGKRYKDKWNSPFLRKFTNTRESVISRAYYKASDPFKMFNLKAKGTVLELGCTPGGVSQYLLESGFKVIGVDPAKVDKEIKDHKDFTFINLPCQKYRPKMNHDVRIIFSDMNLDPKFVINEVLRLERFFPKVTDFLITIKTSNPNFLNEVDKFRTLFGKLKPSSIDFLQIPYHRKEFLAYIRK